MRKGACLTMSSLGTLFPRSTNPDRHSSAPLLFLVIYNDSPQAKRFLRFLAYRTSREFLWLDSIRQSCPCCMGPLTALNLDSESSEYWLGLLLNEHDEP